MAPTVFEICAGGGGQALGLEWAGFQCVGAAEIDPHACSTLRLNRPHWRIVEQDVRLLSGQEYQGADLFAGGVPCPPFSIAGKQLGADDERDLFPEALRLVGEIRPRAVMLENVPGFAAEKFKLYRHRLLDALWNLGYRADWRILTASDYGVPQLRPRFILVALREEDYGFFSWPAPLEEKRTVGESLADLVASRGWKGARKWVKRAAGIGPTIVGGSKKHGGPDLGPTRAKRQWLELGVDGMGISDGAPEKDFPIEGNLRLTVQMVARIQGFPDDWIFTGKKTNSYRQVGNAFPPPVAAAVGRSILRAFAHMYETTDSERQLRILDSPCITAADSTRLA